jgi:hypothetical protein
MSSKSRTPVAGAKFQDLQRPRVGVDPVAYRRERPSWRIARLDTASDWGWHVVDTHTALNCIHCKLRQFEGMAWDEIERGGSHSVEVGKIIPEARKRLEDLKISHDPLFSLRLSGKERIWGYRVGNVLSIIWWDPEHKICPSHKKHT